MYYINALDGSIIFVQDCLVDYTKRNSCSYINDNRTNQFVNSGDTKHQNLKSESNVYSTISGIITSQYYTNYYPLNPQLYYPKINLIRTLDNSGAQIGISYSNSNGYYSINGNGATQIEFYLQNDWIKCYKNSLPSKVLLPINSSTINLDWLSYEFDENSNQFYWLTKMHDQYYKTKLNFNGLDYQMHVNRIADNGTNAFFAPSSHSITTGAQLGVQWGNSKDVLCHEYSHGAITSIYLNLIRLIFIGNDLECAAMDEGLADYFAISFINSGSIIGSDLPSTVPNNPRNLNNNNTYNPNMNYYYNGTVIGGACWDLRSIGGQKYTDPVIITALQVSPHAFSFSDFYYNVTIANTLVDGGFTTQQLNWAFSRHGITLGNNYMSKRTASEIALEKNDSQFETNLNQNFPNPFNPTTEISFSLSAETQVSLDIFDLLGRKLVNLVDRIMEPGSYKIKWNAQDYSSGIYFFKLQTKEKIMLKKMFLLK